MSEIYFINIICAKKYITKDNSNSKLTIIEFTIADYIGKKEDFELTILNFTW